MSLKNTKEYTQKLQTVDRIMDLLSNVKRMDVQSYERILTMLAQDKVMQEAVNSYREFNNIEQIDFSEISSFEDLKNAKYNLTFAQILDAMQTMKVDDG